MTPKKHLHLGQKQENKPQWNTFQPGLWSRSLKFVFRFHSPTLWGKAVVWIIQWFPVFNRPKHFGLEPKTYYA